MNNIELEAKIGFILGELSETKGIISMVDVLISLGYLSQADYENWRLGRIPFLEKACHTNLNKLTTINCCIRQWAEQMKLKPSLTVYTKFGKGPKRILRFSKSGAANIEEAWSTHFINTIQIYKLKELKRATLPDEAPTGLFSEV
jgi:hypothetical protein